MVEEEEEEEEAMLNKLSAQTLLSSDAGRQEEIMKSLSIQTFGLLPLICLPPLGQTDPIDMSGSRLPPNSSTHSLILVSRRWMDIVLFVQSFLEAFYKRFHDQMNASPQVQRPKMKLTNRLTGEQSFR